jgi:hypothetical protein
MSSLFSSVELSVAHLFIVSMIYTTFLTHHHHHHQSTLPLSPYKIPVLTIDNFCNGLYSLQ